MPVRTLVEVVDPARHPTEPAIDVQQIHVARRLVDDVSRALLQGAHLLENHFELRVRTQGHARGLSMAFAVSTSEIGAPRRLTGYGDA